MPIALPSIGLTGQNVAGQGAAGQGARRVVAIGDEVREALRALIARAIREGIPPYDAARIIRGMVGLDPRRANAVMNYRAGLIDSGLSIARVDRMVDKYSEKKLRERASTIARTETMAALNRGAAATFKEAQKDGLLGSSARKTWIVTPDDRLCPSCEPLDDVSVGIHEQFQTELGPVDGPPLHPNCRCALVAEP